MKRLVLTPLIIAVLGAVALVANSGTQTRTVYFNAVDKQGVPVADLNATDIVVKEGGRVQTPITVARATTPMRIAMVIDDRGLGVPEVRESLAAFVDTFSDHAQVGIFSTSRPEITVVDFTQSPHALLAGIQDLVRSDAILGLGLESLTYELAHRFETQGTARPVMIVVTIDGRCVTGWSLTSGLCPSVLDAKQENWPSVVEQLQRSGTTFFSVVARHTSPGDHDPVIDAGAEATGGRVEAVLTDSAIPVALKRITDDLLHQYAVTYNGSPTPKEGARLSVAVTRTGVVIHAPERVGVR